MSPCHPKIGESKQRMQLSGIFSKSAVADLGKSELVLDHPEGVLDFCPNAGFELLNSFKDSVGSAVGELFSLSGPHGDVPVGGCGDPLFYSSVPRIGKDIGLRSMQQVLSLGDVMNIGRGAGNAVYQPGLSIHPNMGLHAKVPLVTFFGLVHLRVPRTENVGF